nr:MAG TPA: hypothetical protein [Caudoviricetes sp.]
MRCFPERFFNALIFACVCGISFTPNCASKNQKYQYPQDDKFGIATLFLFAVRADFRFFWYLCHTVLAIFHFLFVIHFDNSFLFFIIILLM